VSDQNAELVSRLLTALNRRDHVEMASCYHPDATFRDIAFDLKQKKQIHAMWHMISETDLRAAFRVLQVDNEHGTAEVVDDCTFSQTNRPVHNVIVSHFHFQDGLILEHRDDCDAHRWADMALGGILGFLVGRLRFLRSFQAHRLLQAFIAKHSEYQ